MKIEDIKLGKRYYVKEGIGTNVIMTVCMAITSEGEIVMWNKHGMPCNNAPLFLALPSQVLAETVQLYQELEEQIRNRVREELIEEGYVKNTQEDTKPNWFKRLFRF